MISSENAGKDTIEGIFLVLFAERVWVLIPPYVSFAGVGCIVVLEEN